MARSERQGGTMGEKDLQPEGARPPLSGRSHSTKNLSSQPPRGKKGRKNYQPQEGQEGDEYTNLATRAQTTLDQRNLHRTDREAAFQQSDWAQLHSGDFDYVDESSRRRRDEFKLHRKHREFQSHSALRMNSDLAREILNVNFDASEQDVKAAYKHLLKRVHPDAGGSNFFTKQLTEARDTLLNHCTTEKTYRPFDDRQYLLFSANKWVVISAMITLAVALILFTVVAVIQD